MTCDKITVITVVRNGEKTLEQTMLSVLNQTYANVEYIVVDGASTDGTLGIIKRYDEQIKSGAFPNISFRWMSEPDAGVYDAMNRGIDLATGAWISFMNSGDYFTTNGVVEAVFAQGDFTAVDVVYGNSTVLNEDGSRFAIPADDSVLVLRWGPTYRHGASFVKASVHKAFKFDLAKTKKLTYALDFCCIFELFAAGKTFRKVDVNVLVFAKDGISNNLTRSLWYNYLIVSRGKSKVAPFLRYLRQLCTVTARRSIVTKYAYYFFALYVCNNIIAHIPAWRVRKFYYRLWGMKIGRKSLLNMSQYFFSVNKISIGSNTHVNRGCFFDARAGIAIGNNVSISHRVTLMTGSHDARSKTLTGDFRPITIEDYVWIGVNATILKGVTVGRGAVVAAGAVVTKDVAPYTIAGGVPAKKIGDRRKDLEYAPAWGIPFV